MGVSIHKLSIIRLNKVSCFHRHLLFFAVKPDHFFFNHNRCNEFISADEQQNYPDFSVLRNLAVGYGGTYSKVCIGTGIDIA